MAAKHETTVGTAIALSAADAVFNVFDATMQPSSEYTERKAQGAGLSPLPGVLGGQSGTCTFMVELTGGATVPAWAATFLPACGLKNTSGVFTPESIPPEGASSGAKTLTIGLYEDGKLKKLHGAMGNAVFNFVAGKVVSIEFTFTGVWDAPTDVALLAPTYPTTAPLRFAAAALTIGSVSPAIAEMTLDLGNVVTLREHQDQVSGFHSAVITDRRLNGTITLEAAKVATYDPYGDWLARTERALAFALGSVGNRAQFAAPRLQLTGPQEGERNGLQTDALAYQLNRSAAAGDDELTLTLD
jgi:hypothetical protein